MEPTSASQPLTPPASGIRWVALLAAAVALLHIATNTRYGFHRDELQFLYDSRHLAWGFIVYPPFTPAVVHLSEKLFGLHLEGLRLASALAQAAVILTAGAMARAAGARPRAQLFCAFCVAFAPYALFQGTEFQYGSFDLLFTVLVSLGVLQLLATRNPRWWLLVGVAGALGILTKYTILFFLAGIVLAFAITPARRLLATREFALAIVLLLLITLPNFLWQVHHHFATLTFLQHIHQRDIRNGRGNSFWTDQLWLCTLVPALPVWITGLVRAIRSPRWRPAAIVFVAFVLFFGLTHARGYYPAPTYPLLLALGVEPVAAWLAGRGVLLRRSLIGTWSVLFAACAVLFTVILIPLTTSGPLFQFSLENNGDLREEFGWPQLLTSVVQVRDQLSPAERSSYGIFVNNYGELGYLELYGTAAGLPHPMSTVNSAYYLTQPAQPPNTLIVLDYHAKRVNELFTNCRLAMTIPYPADISNEESSDGSEIYVCGAPRGGWENFWKSYQRFA